MFGYLVKFHKGNCVRQRVFAALFVVILLNSIPFIAWEREEAVVAAPPEQSQPEQQPPTQEEENALQLRVFREAVMQGATEEGRIDAAVGLLLRDDPARRDALVEILKASDNSQAQQAVCKALIKSRGLGQEIVSREDFLEPLMQVLSVSAPEQAVLAAEALLLFDFKDIEKGLNEIIQGPQADPKSQINAVYALQIRSEPKALRKLIELSGDSDVVVAKAAENALWEAFGIRIGTSRDELLKWKQKNPDDIRRERIRLQARKLREIQAERDLWQKLYLLSLDKQYDIADELARAQMTLEKLGSDLAAVRIWALGKATQLQATDQEALREKLLSLLSDKLRDVRFQTAKVLNNLSTLNPAQKLLESLKQENDPEVALAMFEALGEACYFAFSPGSEIQLSSDIKDEVMKIASEYLVEEETERAREGAEVIGKILELNNLSEESVGYYLDIIYQRYLKAVEEDPILRADLLSMMANLCVQGSPKLQASKKFEASFITAMRIVDSPSLRVAAAKGMASIDQVKALSLAKQNQLMFDENPAVRQALIELAGTTGGTEDLGWLLEMMNINGQADQVWQAAKSICQRQKCAFLLEWVPNLEKNGSRGDYVREILELAEQKAAAENATESLIVAQEKIIRWFVDRGAWGQAVLYLDKIQFSIQGNSFGENTVAEILLIYLFSSDLEKISQLIENKLVKEDFSESSLILEKLNSFFNDEAVSQDSKRSIFGIIAAINVENRPIWQGFKGKWSSLHGTPPAPEAVPEATPEVVPEAQPESPA